jgi:ribosomal peptide maturation radical SAM protein 1
LFFENKANLTREQLRVMYVGGVRSIQPGIESLSSHVLALMRKGCTMLQNVRLLKWCRYYGIRVSWNLLWGFPGETEEDYRRELEVLRAISHLQPPRGGWPIRLDRFSPYFEQRDQYPIADIKPAAGYRHVYPPDVNLQRVAYFFDHVMGDTVEARVHDPTLDWLEEWQRRWESEKPDTLTYLRIPETLLISDRRGPGAGKVHTITGPWAVAYAYCCETMHSATQIAQHLAATTDTDAGGEEMLAAGLDDLCRKALMVKEDGQYLSLAIPVNPNW